MNKKIILLLLLLYSGNYQFSLKAQNLYVDFKNGIENAKQIGSIQKLTFENNKMVFTYISGTSEMFSVSSIQKISFISVFTGINDFASEKNNNQISVYPNPVANELNFKNLPESSSDLFIYRMDGALVLQTQINKFENTVDLSNLAVGIYLVRVNNQIIKISKI